MVWAWNLICGRFINFKYGRKILTLLTFGCPSNDYFLAHPPSTTDLSYSWSSSARMTSSENANHPLNWNFKNQSTKEQFHLKQPQTERDMQRFITVGSNTDSNGAGVSKFMLALRRVSEKSVTRPKRYRHVRFDHSWPTRPYPQAHSISWFTRREKLRVYLSHENTISLDDNEHCSCIII